MITGSVHLPQSLCFTACPQSVLRSRRLQQRTTNEPRQQPRQHLAPRQHRCKTISAGSKEDREVVVSPPVAALKSLQTKLQGPQSSTGGTHFNKPKCTYPFAHSAEAYTFYADTVNQEPAPDDVPDYKVVVGLCAAVSLICSIDRASISVAIVPMAEQFGWSDSAKGAISSSFFLGYTVTNLIGEANTVARTHSNICLCSSNGVILL